MIGNLQLVRVIAATAVVYYHTGATIGGLRTELYGVALFFTLSGYLMCKVSDRSAWQFAWDRLWRIVPAYWIATIILLTLSGTWRYRPVEHTIMSLLFFPHESADKFYPVLGVGWTLNMEMYFYAIFTFAIAINQKLAPILAGLTIMGLKLGLPFITKDPAYVFYYTHDYVQFFCLGIVVWYGTENIKNLRFRMWKSIFPIAIVIYAWSIIVLDVHMLIAVTLLFALAVASAHAGADVKTPWIMLLGNASYACYLLHTILIYEFGQQGLPVNGTLPFTIGIIFASWVCALAWHMSVERLIAILRKYADLESLSFSSMRHLMQNLLFRSYVK